MSRAPVPDDDPYVKEIFKNKPEPKTSTKTFVQNANKIPSPVNLKIKETDSLRELWKRNDACMQNRNRNQQPTACGFEIAVAEEDRIEEKKKKSIEEKGKVHILPSPKKNPEDYKSPYDTPMSNNMIRLFESSFKHASFRQNCKEPEVYPVESIMLTDSQKFAAERNKRIIDGVVGTNKEITETKLKLILRRFSIYDSEMITKIKAETGLVGKSIKLLLLEAANDSECKGTAASIHHAVTTSITNMRFAAISPRK